MKDSGTLTVLLVPGGGRETRTYHFSRRRIRAALALGGALALVLALITGTWWFLAARAFKVAELESQIRALESERSRMDDLAGQLQALEGEYARIRSLFVADTIPRSSELWLPPIGARSQGSGPGSGGASEPTSWPLTERGFITQALLEGARGEHPGLDIAIPTDSYIRAAGDAVVADAAEDPIYGNFVVLDHGGGFRTVYAHASVVLVERGAEVRQNEVIALSGSTGRSTAPHLHFEILRDGVPVDPLTMVRQP